MKMTVMMVTRMIMMVLLSLMTADDEDHDGTDKDDDSHDADQSSHGEFMMTMMRRVRVISRPDIITVAVNNSHDFRRPGFVVCRTRGCTTLHSRAGFPVPVPCCLETVGLEADMYSEWF